MNARIAGLFGLAALVAGAALSCKSDPTADGVGTPSQVLLNFKSITMSVGDSATVTAQVVDVRNTPLEAPVNFTACDASVTAGLDPSYNPEPPLSKRAIIHAVGPNATCVVASSSGAKPDTSSLLILPISFTGAVTPTTQAGGDTLTISSTAVLKFTSSTTVTFHSGQVGTVVSQTPDALKLLVPFSDAGTLSYTGIGLSYLPGTTVSLPGTGSFTQTGDFWSAAGSWQTAPDITGLLPASGAQSFMIAHLSTANSAVCPEVVTDGSVGPCDMFKFTLADSMTLNFIADWEGAATDPDVDIYVCSDTTVANFGTKCFESGTAGATGAKPQKIGNFAYPAGSHWFVIENFCAGDPTEATCPGSPSRNHFVTIVRP